MVLPNISTLTLEEKRQLSAQLAYSLASAGFDVSREHAMFFEDVCEALALLPKARPPLEAFMRKFGVARYEAACAQVREFVDNGCGLVLRGVERHALTRRLLGCVVVHLRAKGIPTTPVSLLRSLWALPIVTERQFPGYAEARMLHHIVRLPRAKA